MTVERPDYLSYLLRLWRVKENGDAAWRAALESAQTDQARGFESLEALFQFLREQTGVKPEEVVNNEP
jgi:hypothetical protein